MANLLTITPTTAISAALDGPTLRLNGQPRNLTAQANFTYGSGGTTLDAYLQTSFDNGATWADIANFSFATTSARKVINLNAQTPVTTQATATDGTITANTAVDGMLGPIFRAKYKSSGTYAATTLAIDVQSDQLG